MIKVIFSILTIIIFMNRTIGQTNRIHFYIEHNEKELLDIKVNLDDGNIFSEKIYPSKRMPPIVYNTTLDIHNGKHMITFFDQTRKIKESASFKAEKTKTILIRMRKDVLKNKHIIISEEEIPIK